MRPVVETRITHHTLWQALTGQIPPLALSPAPVPHAVLDSRDVTAGDLFIAFVGQQTDGHHYVGDAIKRGAGAIICEERGRTQAQAQGATIVDCTTGRDAGAILPDDLTPMSALAYIVDSSLAAFQQVGAFQRIHRCSPDLVVVGVTGSVGKTSTKELAAAVLRQRYRTLHSRGNLNGGQGLPFALLELGPEHERAMLEIAMYEMGEVHTQCVLSRPRIGIVTNVEPVHLERLGTIERIVQAKAELVQALPAADDGGVAILNWDDARVKEMAELTRARILRYGLTPEADLWADEIKSAGLEGIRFRFHYRRRGAFGVGEKIESLHVRVPLLGRHSVHTALRAAALGLMEGLSWEEIVAGLQSLSTQLRLVVAPGINGATIIDDTYNASPASTIAALNLLADVEPKSQGRRVAVLGDMRELGDYTAEGHRMVGLRAADVVDLLVTVGDLGKTIGEAALQTGIDAAKVQILVDDQEAVAFLRQELRSDDLVLVKGSRAVGMDVVVTQLLAAVAPPGPS
ncbi:MAG: UDP-N-acetylmuramoylalanyl-D-glutamyl-2, 6-diaminopimelate--D-alanyl-D-alanine ligase [Chloroflexi bacterium]|nr:MAG: UDP-N-acetylmuramoylalanyl-D-glutamyl-2, 6-diaminopimelate--D-alanyl-D-alanine ligase [Chloroflexota bacterium]